MRWRSSCDLGAEAGLIGHHVFSEELVVQLLTEFGGFDVADFLEGEAQRVLEVGGGLRIDAEHAGQVLGVAADVAGLDFDLGTLALAHQGLLGLLVFDRRPC